MSYYDFVVKKEYHFLQNIFTNEELEMSESICNLETYNKCFEMFIYICAQLCVKYNKNSLMENFQDKKVINFIANAQVSDFQTLFEEIKDMKIKGINFERKNKRDQLRVHKIKTVLYVYREIFDFPGYKREISLFVSKNFASSVINLLYCDIWVHHSHVSGNIHGYVQYFCNKKVKELNNQPVSVFAHNLFRFDFFFVRKGLRLSVWRSKDLKMGGKSIRNMSYASIADQVKFIDTIKFYQEHLHALAAGMEPAEHENITKSITTFLETHPRFSFKYFALTFENKKWVGW